MASNTRAERRRSERAARKAAQRFGHQYDDAGVMVAWCVDEPDAIEEAKKATHDGLIQSMGSQRRGGVTWQIHKGESAAKVADDLIATMRADEPDELRDYYRRIRAHVREYGGCVIVTHAPGLPS